MNTEQKLNSSTSTAITANRCYKRINKNRYVANGNCKSNSDLYYLTGTRDYSLWRENYLK